MNSSLSSIPTLEIILFTENLPASFCPSLCRPRKHASISCLLTTPFPAHQQQASHHLKDRALQDQGGSPTASPKNVRKHLEMDSQETDATELVDQLKQSTNLQEQADIIHYLYINKFVFFLSYVLFFFFHIFSRSKFGQALYTTSTCTSLFSFIFQFSHNEHIIVASSFSGRPLPVRSEGSRLGSCLH